MAGALVIGVVGSCGGDAGGREVELVAFADSFSTASRVDYTVNGETKTLDLNDESLRTTIRVDGDFEISMLVTNESDIGQVICAIDGLGDEIGTGGGVTAECQASGTVDGDTVSYRAVSSQVDRIVEPTYRVRDELDTEVDAGDLLTVRVPGDWQSSGIATTISGGGADPGGLELQTLLRSESPESPPRTSVRIDRALDRGSTTLDAWATAFIADLAATVDGDPPDATPHPATIGQFDGFAWRFNGRPFAKFFFTEVAGDLVVVTAEHPSAPSPTQVSMESIVENMTP